MEATPPIPGAFRDWNVLIPIFQHHKILHLFIWPQRKFLESSTLHFDVSGRLRVILDLCITGEGNFPPVAGGGVTSG